MQHFFSGFSVFLVSLGAFFHMGHHMPTQIIEPQDREHVASPSATLLSSPWPKVEGDARHHDDKGDQRNKHQHQQDDQGQDRAPRIKLKNGTSTNWSGYAIETSLTNPQSRIVNDVKSSWVVPSVTCTSKNTYSATWIGIDGYSDNSVEQTGTEQDCINGLPVYSAWYEMYPKASRNVNLSIKPGDLMASEVKYIGGGQFVLSLNDITTGQKFSITQKSNGQRESAEWIMEAPYSGGVLPLANFGTQNFSTASATLGTTTGTINNGAWQYDAITMATSGGTVKAQPSTLTPDGSGFSVKWFSN